MMINHSCPVNKYKYWKDLTANYTTSYSTIQKLNKLTKYQVPEFMEKNKLNKVDEFISIYEPTKRQFQFLK